MKEESVREIGNSDSTSYMNKKPGFSFESREVGLVKSISRTGSEGSYFLDNGPVWEMYKCDPPFPVTNEPADFFVKYWKVESHKLKFPIAFFLAKKDSVTIPLSLLFFVLLFLITGQGKAEESEIPRHIDSEIVFENATLTIEEDIVIHRTGSLTLVNCTIIFTDTISSRVTMVTNHGANLILRNCNVTTDGEGVDYTFDINGNLTIVSSIMTNLGGEIDRSSLLIEGSHRHGISIRGDSTTTITDSEFHDAASFVFYKRYGTLFMNGCLFRNAAMGVFVDEAEVIMSDISFTSRKENCCGVVTLRSRAEISNSEFLLGNNSVYKGNFCVVAHESDISIRDSTFGNSNSAVCIYDSSHASIHNTVFHSNFVGLYMRDSNATVYRSTFDSNDYGISFLHSIPSVIDSEFTGNVYPYHFTLEFQIIAPVLLGGDDEQIFTYVTEAVLLRDASMNEIMTCFPRERPQTRGNILNHRKIDLSGGNPRDVEIIFEIYYKNEFARYRISLTRIASDPVLYLPINYYPPILPNLDAVHLSVTPTTFHPGDTVMITAIIANNGEAEARDVRVFLTSNDVKFREFIIPSISPGEQYHLIYSWNVYQQFGRDVSIKIDPYHEIEQSDRYNLTAWASIDLYPEPRRNLLDEYSLTLVGLVAVAIGFLLWKNIKGRNIRE